MLMKGSFIRWRWESGDSLKSHVALLRIHGTKWRPRYNIIKCKIHAKEPSGKIPSPIMWRRFTDLSVGLKKATCNGEWYDYWSHGVDLIPIHLAPNFALCIVQPLVGSSQVLVGCFAVWPVHHLLIKKMKTDQEKLQFYLTAFQRPFIPTSLSSMVSSTVNMFSL